MKEINLLPKKNIGILQQERTIILIRAIAIFSVLIVLSCWIGLWFLGKNYSADTVDAQQQNVRSRLHVFHAKAIDQLTLVDRVNRIQAILKTRSLLTTNIDLLQKQLPSDVSMETFTVTPKQMAMTVSSSSLPSLKKFIDGLTALVKGKTLLTKVTITNIAVDTISGKYTASVQGIFL